jgi:hypothetical protein
MLYAHQCSPEGPETLIAKFTRGERKSEQYILTYKLPASACAENKHLALTFTCHDTGRIYTANYEFDSGALRPTGPNSGQVTVYNFFRSVSKNLKENDIAAFEAFFHNDLVERDGLQSLIADEDITFDFTVTADDTMVPYCALGELAGSMVIRHKEYGELILQDTYCTNTDCNCQATQIVVLKGQGDLNNPDSSFVAKVNISWAKGKPEGKVEQMGLGQNLPLPAELLDLINSANIHDAFQARYQHIRQAKARYLKAKGFKNESAFRGHAAARSTPPLTRTVTQTLTDNLPRFSRPESEKVGRNDPCPCGSQQKFKKCCGR